jgi:hypothetical protein
VTNYMRRLKHGVALLSPLVMLCGAFILWGSTPAGADTTTFSSSTVGTSGTTPDFSENGPWSMSWEYDCSGSQGYFLVGVNQPSDDASADIGPEEQGSGSSGEDYFYDTGQFSLEIDSGCSWSITVTPNAAAPLAAPVTYSSAQTGATGSPPAFVVQGPWTMSWSYECPSGGLEDEFFVEINEPTDDSNADFGPEETGSAGSGIEYFYDTGQFSLAVLSDCTWSITVSPSSVGALAAPVTYTSAQTGMNGNPQEFTVGGPWTMAWSDQCPATDGGGFFDVAINEPSSDQSTDIGPFQSGTSGTGTDTYSDSGTFSLGVMSTCTWSISITSSAPTPTLTPTPTPTPSPTPTPTPTPTPSPGSASTGQHGYWLVGSDGGIFSFGAAQFHGSTGALHLQRPVVGITPTADDGGYWLVASDGGIFSLGDAGFYGSIPGLGLAPAGSSAPKRLNAPIVGMVPSNDGGGYFMVAADGGVFAFGDAKFEGSCPGIGGCSGAAVAVMPGASGNGYWLVTATGHVYAFGDAVNYGQPGAQDVPVTAAARTGDGGGYWLLYANGAVATFGDARNLGNPIGTLGGSNPATAIFTTSSGGGYWIASATGSVYAYGDASADGGMSGQHLNGSVIAGTGW